MLRFISCFLAVFLFCRALPEEGARAEEVPAGDVRAKAVPAGDARVEGVPAGDARVEGVKVCPTLVEAERKVVLSGRWHLYYGVFKEPALEFIFDDPSPHNVLRFTTHVTENSRYAINDFHFFLDKNTRSS